MALPSKLYRFKIELSHLDKNIYQSLTDIQKKFCDDALILACINKITDRVSKLCYYGTNVNCTDQNKRSPIIYACKNGSLDIVKILCENNANINHLDFEKMTPLIHASENGHFEIVKELCSRGAIIKHYDKSGWDALLAADAHEYKDIYNFLLDQLQLKN